MQDRVPPLRVDVSQDGVIATITVSGELDLTCAPYLTECLLQVAESRPERVVLDLDGLVFLDVAGARALDEAYRVLDAGCPVILRRLRPSARRMLELTGLMGHRRPGRPAAGESLGPGTQPEDPLSAADPVGHTNPRAGS